MIKGKIIITDNGLRTEFDGPPEDVKVGVYKFQVTEVVDQRMTESQRLRSAVVNGFNKGVHGGVHFENQNTFERMIDSIVDYVERHIKGGGK